MLVLLFLSVFLSVSLSVSVSEWLSGWVLCTRKSFLRVCLCDNHMDSLTDELTFQVLCFDF